MKNALLTLAAVAALSGPALSQVVDPFKDTLVLYDFNALSHFNDPNAPAYCAPCVSATNLSLNGLSQSLHFSGGPDGSKFRCFAGWDVAKDYTFIRPDLSPAPQTLSFDVTVHPDSIAGITGLSLDWKRPSVSSVDTITASIFWEDASGVVQHHTSGPVSLTGSSGWNHLSFVSNSSSESFPSGLDTAGETFHVELYAYGGQGGTLYLDNIVLEGYCAPIPEPSGALLLGATGLAILIRRRSRHC
ncbi:MAG: PEP-CTERM sorting domain-containing protein [Verrucomicrobiaceae bacterium]|nr:PEP-CTERM sorting domain-containing protein [Verrucomicrobiaceae bacterium]